MFRGIPGNLHGLIIRLNPEIYWVCPAKLDRQPLNVISDGKLYLYGSRKILRHNSLIEDYILPGPRQEIHAAVHRGVILITGGIQLLHLVIIQGPFQVAVIGVIFRVRHIGR